jgi:hypothetical protein
LKLPDPTGRQSTALPGNLISLYIVPLYPAYPAIWGGWGMLDKCRKMDPKKEIGIQKNKKTPFGLKVSVI